MSEIAFGSTKSTLTHSPIYQKEVSTCTMLIFFQGSEAHSNEEGKNEEAAEKHDSVFRCSDFVRNKFYISVVQPAEPFSIYPRK